METRVSGSFSCIGVDDSAPAGFQKVVEGFAAVLFPPAKTTAAAVTQTVKEGKKKINLGGEEDDGDAFKDGDDDQSIFYNPAQVVNRDLSVCAIEAFSRMRVGEAPRRGGTKEGITILEALSASGLRAVRYWKEVTGVKYIIANDLDSDAVTCIKRNCSFNGIPIVAPTMSANTPEEQQQQQQQQAPVAAAPEGLAVARGVVPNHDDAIVLMQRLALSPKFFQGSRVVLQKSDAATGSPIFEPLLQQELMDVVDLDPYGTASPFLDSAFACIKEGGLMLVTSTDSPILCGNYPDTCHAKYQSIMMKPDSCHEVAVRILLAAAERAANKYKKYIVPLISLHIDFYVRVFFRVYTQAAESKLTVAKLAHVAQCTRCPAYWLSPLGRCKPSRKEVDRARREKNDKRMRDNDNEAAAAAPVASDALPEETPVNSGEAREPESIYPAPPNRQQPFKTSCPTVDAWLPNSGNHCSVCGGHISVGGPIYAAPTQNREFLKTLLEVIDERDGEGRLTATDRVKGLVHAAMDELPEAPLFYSLPEVASFIKSRLPPTPNFVGALSRLGYRFSQVHCHRSGIKTTCPPLTLIRAMLAYKNYALEENDGVDATEKAAAAVSTSRVVLPSVTPLEGLDFSYDKQYDFRSSSTGVSKFIPNPAGWGPKRRHQGAAETEEA